jgi:hypothetical protein
MAISHAFWWLMVCHVVCFFIHNLSDYLGYLSYKQAILIKKEQEEDPLREYEEYDENEDN